MFKLYTVIFNHLDLKLLVYLMKPSRVVPCTALSTVTSVKFWEKEAGNALFIMVVSKYQYLRFPLTN